MDEVLNVSHDVTAAINHNEPVVALESSLIAHGLPPGLNVETALAMEERVRSHGATPATIGLIEGKVRVGLTREEIERLGAGNAAKLAVRDLPYAVARKLDGGTTVSSTIRIAATAGIAVAATGGIGGVHLGITRTHDISADLWELARTPVVLVCSGPKAVLDIAATAEWLETHGVPVYGWQTDELPAFYSRSSGVGVSRIESACEAAEIARLSGGAMGMRCAMIVAVPVPEADEVDVKPQIDQATHEAMEKDISGKALTPYLLQRVGELTDGASTRANIALLRNNAAVAAEIAAALAESSRRRMGFMV